MAHKKKTIIYVGGFELPNKNAAAQRVVAVAKLFKTLGFNVVFLGVDKSLDAASQIQNTKVTHFGFESWAVPYPNGGKEWLKQISSVSDISYIIKNYYEDDLFAVVCYNHPFVSQLRISKICKKFKAFYIPDATEWYDLGGNIFFKAIKWMDTSLRMRYVHFKADGMIATSKYLHHFYKNGVDPIVELPTLFDTKSLSLVPVSSKAKSPDTKYLMYAGSAFNLDRIEKDRSNIKDRLDVVIAMLSEVFDQGIKFVLNIYGLNKENYLQAFTEHTTVLDKMSNAVFFHGRKPHEEIIAVTKWSDFTIFIRRIDRVIEAGFPSKFSESMSCGTPVITNLISNIEGFMAEGENGFLIDLNNRKAQVEKMIEILSMPISEVEMMKKFCLDNPIFDYRNYVAPVEKFFTQIKSKKV